MFLARDRNRFFREMRALVASTGAKPAKPALADDRIERMSETNHALDTVIGPLLEAYAEIVRKAGRTAEFKTLHGAADYFPVRAAVAEFWLDMTEVPGVAQYFMRMESDGGDWTVTSRPGLDRQRSRHESGQIAIPASKKLAHTVEGALQHFIRASM